LSFSEFLLRLFKKKVEIQTVPIDEYNKLRKELEQRQAIRDSLTKENERIIKQTEITLAEIEQVEFEMRIEKIKNILSALSITNEERGKLLETLVNSDLSVEFIAETYAPITKKNIIVETKLPQKSIPDRSKDLTYLR
jgi:hypothetical protein